MIRKVQGILLLSHPKPMVTVIVSDFKLPHHRLSAHADLPV